MRHTAGQHADALQLLRLPQIVFDLLPLGDIIPHLVLAAAGAKDGTNHADKSAWADWLFEDRDIRRVTENVHEVSARRPEAAAGGGQKQELEIGPGGLGLQLGEEDFGAA